MKLFLVVLTGLILTGCASKQTSSADARQDLENKWSKRVGSATKSDFIEQFGTAEWCRPQPTGDETCRFYKKLATKWMGESKRDKKSYEAFEEVVADFDSNGTLKTFKANAQH